VKIENFSDFQGIGYNRPMGILDNLENSEFAWDEEWQTESSGIIKIYSDTCCNGCTCKSEKDHTKEA
jgi:hypothetical protein